MSDLSDPTDGALLERIEGYCDLVPRADTVPQEVGAFTLFVSRGGPGAYDYYARPRLGLDRPVTAADVGAVLDRQVELGVPRALEWVDETTPSLLAAAEASGMVVERCPLLVLVGAPVTPPVEAQVRVLEADDPDLAGVLASISVGFGHPGTATGAVGSTERDAEAASRVHGASATASAVRAGRTVVVGALVAGVGAVGGGSHRPRGDTTEVVGVGVLPAYRRRGAAGAVTAALARTALDAGLTTVFCGAQDDAVAHVYERVGFRRVGTACIGRVE
ncbi:GNAT family N-acetyltransferase [Dermatophilaceae bacterium Soc4.6]